MAIFSAILFVASVAYQYNQYKKQKKAMAAAKDEAAGINFNIKGQAVSVYRYYGFNKVEAYPVFWEVSNNYIHAAGLPGGATTTNNQNNTVLSIVNQSMFVGAHGQLNRGSAAKNQSPSIVANCGFPGTQTASMSNPPEGTLAFLTNNSYFAGNTGAQIVIRRNGVAWFGPRPGTPATNYYRNAAEYQVAIPQFWTFVDTYENWVKYSQQRNYKMAGVSGSSFVDYSHVHGLAGNQSGNRSEFLYAQYVLGLAPFSRVIGVEIDGESAGKEEYVHHRIHVKNGTYSTPDPMITSNTVNSRTTARFTNLTTASCCFKINRDEPQYSGLPNLEFTVWGSPVRDIVFEEGNYSFSEERYFSRNFALILADYLTDPVAGRGLADSKLNLKTFYDAAQLADEVVQANSNYSSYNAVWRDPESSYLDTTLTDNTYRFTFDGFIDTSQPIRSNVKKILNAGDESDIVWSEGQYKLVTHYPKNSTEANSLSVAVITDDQIVQGSISIQYPNQEIRTNQTTITFQDGNKKLRSNTKIWPEEGSLPYTTYMAQDNQNQLRVTESIEYTNDPYQALAKAEYLTRYSRGLITIDFETTKAGFRLEPGDVFTLNSTELDRTYLLKVKEISAQDQYTIQVKSALFDWSVFAWNVNDTDPGSSIPTPDVYRRGARDPLFTPAAPTAFPVSAGVLQWVPAEITGNITYRVYISADEDTERTSLGSTESENFVIPPLVQGSYIFTIQTYHNSILLDEISLAYDHADTTLIPPEVVDPSLIPWNSTTLYLYKKHTSMASAPVMFFGEMSYNFSTNNLTGGTLNGWSRTIPVTTGPGEYVWVASVNLRTQSVITSVPFASWSLASLYSGSTSSGVDTFSTLPAEGEPDQLVMKIPEGILYRWDDIAEEWTEDVYSGVLDNTITSAKIVSGAVIASKIAVGNLAAISADLGAITAGSLNINNRFIVASDGITTIQSSTSGARLVIQSNRIDVYDDDNNLRVRIGELD